MHRRRLVLVRQQFAFGRHDLRDFHVFVSDMVISFASTVRRPGTAIYTMRQRSPDLGLHMRFQIQKRALRILICKKARYRDHPGPMEAAGLTLLVKLILRSFERHGQRYVILVDAKAILSAAQRGRTSAQSIQRQMRQLAGLTLAGPLQLHFLYIPSEDNPADAPSRGLPCPERGRARL